MLSFAKTREITPRPVRGPPTFPHHDGLLCFVCAKATAERRGLHCQPTPTTRDMCVYLYVSSCVELPRQGAGKGSKIRWHISVVYMGRCQNPPLPLISLRFFEVVPGFTRNKRRKLPRTTPKTIFRRVLGAIGEKYTFLGVFFCVFRLFFTPHALQPQNR